MDKIINFIFYFLQNKKGATTVEYGLILVVVAVVIGFTVYGEQGISTGIQSKFIELKRMITSAVS
ncbi:Flp family type IVb pilin [Glaesserella sp.]|uniref:Flp family type IVb pilin n=1 Tax=Glaesserella sp. TaxID=2094731 RepID=UPI0035A0B66C